MTRCSTGNRWSIAPAPLPSGRSSLPLDRLLPEAAALSLEGGDPVVSDLEFTPVFVHRVSHTVLQLGEFGRK